jgi:hypothetical protein
MDARTSAGVRGFARGLGVVILPLVVFCGVPWAACPSYARLCEEAGGDFFEIADVVHHCLMPEPITAAQPCPPGFEPSDEQANLCTTVGPMTCTCVAPWSRSCVTAP